MSLHNVKLILYMQYQFSGARELGVFSVNDLLLIFSPIYKFGFNLFLLILCCSYHVYSYNQYINEQMH